jgi:hypothetical protein
MKKVVSKYRCKQAELYEVVSVILLSLRELLVYFTAFKPKYTSGFVDSLEAELKAVMSLPDYDQRRANQIVVRELAVEQLLAVRHGLNSLRAYIRSAYKNEAVRRAKEKEAGFEKYKSAMKCNWEALKDILYKCKMFLVNNEVALMENDNMPSGFKAHFDALADGMIAQIPAVLNTRENNEEKTQTKIAANNVLFDKIMDVCEDGNVVFSQDKAKYDQFVFAQVLKLVTPPGAAGMKGVIKDVVSSVPLAGAMVTIKQNDLAEVSAMTDGAGKYVFANLAVGRYKGVVRLEGYRDFYFDIVIKTGETNYENFWLQIVEGLG